MRKPFKGMWYWEFQVGPIVLRWQHDMDHKGNRRFRIGRFSAWRVIGWRPPMKFRQPMRYWKLRRSIKQTRRAV